MQDGPSSFFKSWEGFLPPHAVVMAKAVASPASHEILSSGEQATSIQFLVEAPGVSHPAEKQLLGKILAALSIAEQDVQIVERLGSELPCARLCLRFVLDGSESEQAGEWTPLARSAGTDIPALCTYSLSAMLEQPGLKKPVWAHLKAASARLEGNSK